MKLKFTFLPFEYVIFGATIWIMELFRCLQFTKNRERLRCAEVENISKGKWESQLNL